VNTFDAVINFVVMSVYVFAALVYYFCNIIILLVLNTSLLLLTILF